MRFSISILILFLSVPLLASSEEVKGTPNPDEKVEEKEAKNEEEEEEKAKTKELLMHGAIDLDIRKLTEAFEKGMSPNTEFEKDPEGPTALFMVIHQTSEAADSGDRLTCAELILSKSPDYWKKNKEKHTAFTLALKNGYSALAEAIWDHVVARYVNASAHRRQVDLKRFSLERPKRSPLPLTRAIQLGNVSLIKKILKAKGGTDSSCLEASLSKSREIRRMVLDQFIEDFPDNFIENLFFQQHLIQLFEDRDMDLLNHFKDNLLKTNYLEVTNLETMPGNLLLIYFTIKKNIWAVRFLVLEWNFDIRFGSPLETFLCYSHGNLSNSEMIGALLELGERSYPTSSWNKGRFNQVRRTFPTLFKNLPKSEEEEKSRVRKRPLHKPKTLKIPESHSKLRDKYFPRIVHGSCLVVEKAPEGN